MEKFKILHTKYDKTDCLLRILITLNRPEPELLTASLNKLQTRKWALGGMQQYGINDVFYRQYFWWSSTVAQRRGQVRTCLWSTSALWTLVFSSCVVFSYNFICLGLLLSVWLLVSKTGSTWWRVRSLCCLLACWPGALWQIFKSVEIVFTKVKGENDLIGLYSLKTCSIAW